MNQEIEITLKLSLSVDAKLSRWACLLLAEDYCAKLAELVPEEQCAHPEKASVHDLREEAQIYSEQLPGRGEYDCGKLRTVGDLRAAAFRIGRPDIHDALCWHSQSLPGDISLDQANELVARAVNEFGVKS